jgi:hypothetical protein
VSTTSVEMTGDFTAQVEFSAPSASMRRLMSEEAERWKQMKQASAKNDKRLLSRLASLFRKG